MLTSISGFSKSFMILLIFRSALVYFEMFGDVRVAISREKELKGWVRRRKVALIESMNPQWNDLSAGRMQVVAKTAGGSS